jgi:leader peptidase (prepilin peptidase)/N-methyltransferase
MIGAFLGWRAIPIALLVASFTGSVVGVAAIAWQRAGSRYPIPFGPFLSFGALCYLFFGKEIIEWYF